LNTQTDTSTIRFQGTGIPLIDLALGMLCKIRPFGKCFLRIPLFSAGFPVFMVEGAAVLRLEVFPLIP
jgi:hypothetical protein